mmetsp:Transcript_29942/g.89053  ORF Transcript_29942/g.89053 Transcript_29942/m.89053 type:complete len:216 (-) Transcript_29942:1006-1653(-)
MVSQPPTEKESSNGQTPRLDTLCLLDSYNTSHSAASSSIKVALWNLSRARRSRGGFHLGGGGSGGLSALDVREELRAKAVLSCAENSASARAADETKPGKVDMFTLYPEGIPTTDVSPNENDNKSTDKSTGLRQRKNAPKGVKDENKSAWTEETPELDTEEQRFRSSDPIDLFGGFPPPALKHAQIEARKALAAYVEAANLAAEIIHIINEGESS